MSKRQKQFYCKLGQAVVNVSLMLAMSSVFAFYFVYALVKQEEKSMEEFLKRYGGYIIGFLFTPVTCLIFKTFKRTLKGTVHKENAKKHTNKGDKF